MVELVELVETWDDLALARGFDRFNQRRGAPTSSRWQTLRVVEFDFSGTVIEWRGPAPYYFIALPDWVAEQIGAVARAVSYGWGVIPVEATIGRTTWTTSLFPRDGGYLLPVKTAVRDAEKVAVDQVAEVTLRIRGM